MEELVELRKKIDIIDQNLLSLITERIAVMKQVGAVKKHAGKPIRDMRREDEKIAMLLTQSSLPPQLVKQIWGVFFESSEEIEK